MLKRNAVLLAAGAAFVALDASAALAQTTSSRRIPITKEAPGEVVAPRVDTVTVYRTDTLRTMPDTVTLTNTVTRVDTVMQSVPMVARHIGGLYFGIGGGVAMPYGAIRTVNEPGELAQVNLGWQGLNSILGVRVDGTWNRYARDPDYVTLNSTARTIDRPMMWTGNAGLRLDLPIFNATLGSSVRMRPYLIGGGSYIHYSDLRMKLDRDNPNGQVGVGFGPQQAVFATETNSSTVSGSDHNWGFYGGGGLGFHSGKKEVFVEARAIGWRHGPSNMFERSWNVPIVFGVNFF